MFKTIAGWAGGGLVVLFIFAMFFTTLTEVTEDTVADVGNITNATGLQSGISMTPLALWLGLGAIPLVGIAVYLWQRRIRLGG